MERCEEVLEYKELPDGKYLLIERDDKGKKRLTIFDDKATQTLYEIAAKSLVERVREGRE